MTCACGKRAKCNGGHALVDIIYKETPNVARVVHCMREKYDIYIGRSPYPGEGILGNPYSHQSDTLAEFKVATRVDAIAAFKVYAVERMARDPEFRAAIMACKGRTLGCWCAPKACHGSVILELAEGQQPLFR